LFFFELGIQLKRVDWLEGVEGVVDREGKNISEYKYIGRRLAFIHL
jgi:hypothetical protein